MAYPARDIWLLRLADGRSPAGKPVESKMSLSGSATRLVAGILKAAHGKPGYGHDSIDALLPDRYAAGQVDG